MTCRVVCSLTFSLKFTVFKREGGRSQSDSALLLRIDEKREEYGLRYFLIEDTRTQWMNRMLK